MHFEFYIWAKQHLSLLHQWLVILEWIIATNKSYTSSYLRAKTFMQCIYIIHITLFISIKVVALSHIFNLINSPWYMWTQEVLERSKTILRFIKLHAPWELLCRYAEELNLRAPIQVSFSLWMKLYTLFHNTSFFMPFRKDWSLSFPHDNNSL